MNVIFLQSSENDAIPPQTRHLANNQPALASLTNGLNLNNAALKGMMIDLISAVPPTLALSFQAPNWAFRPPPTFYHLAGVNPSTFPADLVRVHAQWHVYYRPRDDRYEVRDSNEHDDFLNRNLFYEHKYGRLVFAVPSADLDAIANQYRVLRGSTVISSAPAQ